MRPAVIPRCATPAFASWAICRGGRMSAFSTKPPRICSTRPFAISKGDELCVWAVSDPISLPQAEEALRREVPDFDRHLAAGQIELLAASEWYLKGGEFDLQRITGGWNDKLSAALARGYDGMRVSGNAFWLGTKHWKEFCEYERELDRSVASHKMIVLCTYSLQASRTVDMLDVAPAHQCSIALRNGIWEFLETPELKQAKQEIR